MRAKVGQRWYNKQLDRLVEVISTTGIGVDCHEKTFLKDQILNHSRAFFESFYIYLPNQEKVIN